MLASAPRWRQAARRPGQAPPPPPSRLLGHQQACLAAHPWRPAGQAHLSLSLLAAATQAAALQRRAAQRRRCARHAAAGPAPAQLHRLLLPLHCCRQPLPAQEPRCRVQRQEQCQICHLWEDAPAAPALARAAPAPAPAAAARWPGYGPPQCRCHRCSAQQRRALAACSRRMLPQRPGWLPSPAVPQQLRLRLLLPVSLLACYCCCYCPPRALLLPRRWRRQWPPAPAAPAAQRRPAACSRCGRRCQ